MTNDAMTVDKLLAAIKQMKAVRPLPYLASSTVFPDTHAITFNYDDQDFYLAGPGFWDQVPRAEDNLIRNPLFELRVWDLDDPRYWEDRVRTFKALAKTTLAKKAAME